MRSIRSVLCVILVSCFVFLSGCSKKASDEIDFGAWEGTTYRNEYFGLSISVPEDWSVQGRETASRVMDMGETLVAGGDKNLQAALKVSQLQTVNLFMVSEHPLGSPVAFNPNIICVAQRISDMPGIKRGEDYHFHTKRGFQLSNLEVTFPKEITTESLGGVDFDVMYLEMGLCT